MIRQITENLFQYFSTCNVYILRDGDHAVLIDFGDGSVLDALPELGIRCVTDVLMTHHHRDQGQGLSLAEQNGIRIWVPAMERELFEDVEGLWQGRHIFNNYTVRQDRFSLLHPVTVSGSLDDYGCYAFGSYTINVLPVPGHTPGSLALLTGIDGRNVAFTGDLIAGPGKVWSMAATQWSYNGQEGAALSALSLEQLRRSPLDLLLPSHGVVMEDPQAAIDLLSRRMIDLLDARGENPRLLHFIQEPFRRLSPHLLMNQTCVAYSYVLLSESGKALLIDYGYDFIGGFWPGDERAAKRPWLYNIPVLKRDFGVQRVDVVLPTHYHDDHVAGINLLRKVEGTCLWAPENFQPILANPSAYNLPCLWYDPIHADRVLPLGEPLVWEEYTLWLYPFPGHTQYAVAIFVEVDGQRMLFIGDQYQKESGLKWNYVYQNHFNLADYRQSSALMARLAPDLVLSGHWAPIQCNQAYFNALLEGAERIEQLHRDLLPLGEIDPGLESTFCWITPYQATAAPGERIHYRVRVVNPLHQSAAAGLQFVVPQGWSVEPPVAFRTLEAGEEAFFDFTVCAPLDANPARRGRLAVDLTVGDLRLGQQAECLVTLVAPARATPNPIRRLARTRNRPNRC